MRDVALLDSRSDGPSDGGAQAGMGKSNGFLMVAIGTEAVGVNIDV